MKVDALLMDPKDNVVTCVRDVKAGEVVHYRSKNEDLEILAKEAIPFSHKISLTGSYKIWRADRKDHKKDQCRMSGRS